MQNTQNLFKNGRERVIIEKVKPEIDGGKFAAKRVQGDIADIRATVFSDGHDRISAEVLFRKSSDKNWQISPMVHKGNDHWEGFFPVMETGWYTFTIRAWINRFETWYNDILKKYNAGVGFESDLMSGAQLIEHHIKSKKISGNDLAALEEITAELTADNKALEDRMIAVKSGELAKILRNYPLREFAVQYDKELNIICERKKAAFSSWYEFFPRSIWEPGKEKGTLKTCIDRLPYVAGMGFDVLYLPPIHPIGNTKRKGRNNNAETQPGEPGSPWAIGNKEGGHKSVHPELGTPEDLSQLINSVKEYNMEIALDIAFQCSPDHPWVKEHPRWFRKRPDGSIQYAENPPKKYEDIYPVNFETEDWQALWKELKSVFEYWIEQGVKIFRVDNPHTKSVRFWGWLIRELKSDYPDLIFLAEAFTRPAMMYQLAKQGFTQSYTYFTWRNTKWELTRYFEELTRTTVKDFFRPNLWPNTPDILPEFLQVSGRPGFIIRLVLAATLSSSYGIYGPAYELMENTPLEWGREEYLDSEKFEIKHWDIERKESLKNIIREINIVREENAALHNNSSLRFHNIENEQIIAYSKHTPDLSNIILVIVNLDPHHTHSGWVHLPLEKFGIEQHDTYQVFDLITKTRYLWSGEYNYVELNPGVFPAHVFKVRRKIRTEQDFDYFM